MIDVALSVADLVLPATRRLLDQEPGFVIHAETVSPPGRRTSAAVDPATGLTLAILVEGEAADVDAAIASADRAFRETWGRWSPADRAERLERFADIVDAHRDALGQVESLDEGKPTGDTAGYDVPQLSGALRYYAALARDVAYRVPLDAPGYDAVELRQPYGVCAFIVPWNAPLLLFGWGMAAALAAGNTIVVKPAIDASLSILALARLAVEAGLPAGVLNVVTGPGATTGMALASSPRIQRMAFTGSPEAGRLVSAACGSNLVPVKLELGGKGAAVVFDDVDVPAVAAGLAGALSLNAGQVCCTPTRWLVHERIFDAFIEVAVDELASIRLGHGLVDGTRMGPLINHRQRDRIAGLLEQGLSEGAEMLLEGGPITLPELPAGGFVRPVILRGEPDNVCARTEIFGPVAFAMPFRDEAEAVAIANGTPYGLAHAVWTEDAARADRIGMALDAGLIWLDCQLDFAPGIRYNGWHLSGMGGGVLAPDALLDYLRRKSVVRRAGAAS
jgi:acyl-CoA reductase-like NAD-dependent aldehyde dehydrogenase